jgi:hypothetical protein
MLATYNIKMSESVTEHIIDVHEHKPETPITIEIGLLTTTINELEKTIDYYIDDSMYIWDTVFVPFMNSGDCLTLQNLNETKCSSFIDFMTSQRTYKLMMISHGRLTERLNYLLGTR